MRTLRMASRGTAFLSVCALACAPQAGTQAETQAAAAKPAKFEVASIRMIRDKDVVPLMGSPFSPPGAGLFTMHEVSLAIAIEWAFQLHTNQLSGAPDWLDQQCYEISAKPEGDVGLSYDQLRPLVQRLLQDRFHLKYHRETKNTKGYALTIAKGGPRLIPAKGGADHGYLFSGQIDETNRSVGTLAAMIGFVLHQPVVDETGLKGNYDIKLKYAPMDSADSDLPSIFTAVEEQLGLKLQKQSVPVDMFVIDHIDKVPTEN